MTPHPVATAPKEIAPQRAAPPLPAIAATFDQLLSIGLMSPTPSHAQAGNPDAAHSNERPKAKNDKDNAKSAGAAAAVPVPSPQLLPAITVATSSGETKVAAPAAASAFAVKPPDAPALAALTAADAPIVGKADAGKNGEGAKLPPGAAELEARIVAAAPNYVSQPNAALAGLWHHAGESAKSAASAQQGEQTAGAASAGAPPDGTPATQAQTAPPAKEAASLAKYFPADAHAAPTIETAQAAAADPGKTSASAGSAADNSGTITIAPPSAGAMQIAATEAPSANPALPSPGQIPAAWEQVAVNLRQAALNGSDRIEIQLKPASLGAIAVKLDLTHDGRITAVISADRSDTLNLLRQDLHALAQSLRDAGLQADSGSLSFNLRGDPQSFAQNQAPAVGDLNRLDDPAAASSARLEIARHRQHAGALDIEV